MRIKDPARGNGSAPAAAPEGAWPVRNPHLLHRTMIWVFYAGIILLQGLNAAWIDFFPDELLVPLGLVLLPILGGLCLCLFLVGRWALGRRRGYPRPVMWAAVALGMLLIAQAAAFSAAAVGLAVTATLFSLAAAGMAVTAGMHARHVVWMHVGISAVSVVAGLASNTAPGGMILLLLNAFVSAWGGWITGWSIAALEEMMRSHNARRELALAEERLRIARDLHDILGRTLTTISLKSTLAAELIKRDRGSDAALEIDAIRALTQDAATAVRTVTRGRVSSSWPEELAGAHALLSSAGITCAFDGTQPPSTHAETLARVLREAVTNVLRHSAATHVSISARASQQGTLLLVSNDRPNPRESDEGTGLKAMGQHLMELGGTLQVRREPHRFTLEAYLPNKALRKQE